MEYVIRLGNIEYTEEVEEIVKIDCWYDRFTKLWILQKLDANGYQIGDAEYVYGKKAAQERAKELELEYHIS